MLRLKGALTVATAPAFQDAVSVEESSSLILDLSEVSYADSAGIGSLVLAYTSRQKSGRRLALVNPGDRVSNVMRLTRVDLLFAIYPTVAEAEAALP